jgi:transposase
VNLREVVNTVLYLNRSGCQWDMLPHDLQPKNREFNNFPTFFPRVVVVWRGWNQHWLRFCAKI